MQGQGPVIVYSIWSISTIVIMVILALCGFETKKDWTPFIIYLVFSGIASMGIIGYCIKKGK